MAKTSVHAHTSILSEKLRGIWDTCLRQVDFSRDVNSMCYSCVGAPVLPFIRIINARRATVKTPYKQNIAHAPLKHGKLKYGLHFNIKLFVKFPTTDGSKSILQPAIVRKKKNCQTAMRSTKTMYILLTLLGNIRL